MEANPQRETTFFSTTIGSGGVHRFSDLSTAIIKFCMQDGEVASKEISERLTTIQSLVEETKTAIENGENKENLNTSLDSITAEILNTVITLQFFDRISQRMSHAVETVEAISDAASEKSKTISERFTMDDERILYEALLDGCSVEEALERASQKLTDTIECKGNDIELF